MNLAYALLISVVKAILITENYGYGYWMISRPIFGGPLLGLIMGDLQTGLIVGASVELMFMGVLPIGGSVPPNAQMAGLLGTFFAISSGGNAEVGIALAFPVGVLAQFLIMLAWNFNILLVNKADKYIEKGETKKIERTHLLGILIFFIVLFIPTFLAVYFGSDYVTKVVSMLPEKIMQGLKAAAGILPAVGMAMLLRMMNFKSYWSFFLIGFVLSVFLGMNVLSVSLLAIGIVFGTIALSKEKRIIFDDNNLEEKENYLLDNKIIRKTTIRTLFNMTTINYERYMALGFEYAMIPSLKKLYENDEEEYKKALKRHNEFYNCHPYTSNIVVGVMMALEEQRSLGKEISDNTIIATKSALMGPLSGIGDSIFKGVFMTTFAAIGAGLAIEGNPLGPIVFIVPNVLLNLFSRYCFVKYGYKFGVELVSKIRESNVLDKFVEMATIVGMMVVGAMVTSFVKINLVGKWNIAGKDIILQEIVDKILPGFIPLCLTLIFLKILSKENKSSYGLILICFAIGIIGTYIGVL